LPWAADNQAFNQGFKPDKFFPWLEKMETYRSTCLFIVVPDVWGNAIETMQRWRHWRPHFNGWPLAFAAQDGQELFRMPPDYQTLFVGGGNDWRKTGARTCIKQAQAAGKKIHIGRVNWGKQYKMFLLLKGSEEFTCDGTRTRYDGVEKALHAWAGYQAQPPLLQD
jgi:hypothetical protein